MVQDTEAVESKNGGAELKKKNGGMNGWKEAELEDALVREVGYGSWGERSGKNIREKVILMKIR